jgi:hypothetical protein
MSDQVMNEGLPEQSQVGMVESFTGLGPKRKAGSESFS